MLNVIIKSQYHTLSEWCEIVGKYYSEVLSEIYDDSYWKLEDVTIGSAEILEDVIKYEGGVYADQAKSFIEMLYGVQLA